MEKSNLALALSLSLLLLLSGANAQGFEGGGGGREGGGGGGQEGGGGGGQEGGGRGGPGPFMPQRPPFVPVPNPGKNDTIVRVAQFAVGAFNTSMRASLKYVDVLEAAQRMGNEGTDYILAVQATEGTLPPRIFRADVFRSFQGWERLLLFRAVLA